MSTVGQPALRRSCIARAGVFVPQSSLTFPHSFGKKAFNTLPQIQSRHFRSPAIANKRLIGQNTVSAGLSRQTLPTLISRRQFARAPNSGFDPGFDPRKWESDNKKANKWFETRPFARPRRGTLNPQIDLDQNQQKQQVIDNLREQLKTGHFIDEGLPLTRDPHHPDKPFIPMIPRMTDEPYKLATPTPIWDTSRPTPTFRSFIGHYLPSKEKWQRTREMWRNYTRGPLDVLDPKWRRAWRTLFGRRSLLMYSVISLTFIYGFEFWLLQQTPLEDMFEITARNMIRSESFIVIANTLQEMVNDGLLCPVISPLEAKIFLEETSNVGHAYNAQVLKDFAYLTSSFKRTIELSYPDPNNVQEQQGIDHFSQIDTDISYLHIERYLQGLGRFFDILYTRDIEMQRLQNGQPYDFDLLISSRQSFLTRFKTTCITIISPLKTMYRSILDHFELNPNHIAPIQAITLGDHNQLLITTPSPQQPIFATSTSISSSSSPSSSSSSSPSSSPSPSLFSEIFAQNSGPFIPQGSSISSSDLNASISSIDQRLKEAEAWNIDFSKSVTLQFNPHVAKVVDFYFDDLPGMFRYVHPSHIASTEAELHNGWFSQNMLRSTQPIKERYNEILPDLPVFDPPPTSPLHSHILQLYGLENNSFLIKDPNISYTSDFKSRFLTDSFLPTHLQAFKTAYQQSQNVRNIEQILHESALFQHIDARKSKRGEEHSPLALLYMKHAQLERIKQHEELLNSFQKHVGDRLDIDFSLYMPSSTYWGSLPVLKAIQQYINPLVAIIPPSVVNFSSTCLNYASVGVSYYTQTVFNLYKLGWNTIVPPVFNTMFTDTNYLEPVEESLPIARVATFTMAPPKPFETRIEEEIRAPLQQLSYQERQIEIENARTTFNFDGFHKTFSEYARKDYIDMIQHNIEMLRQLRIFCDHLAKRLEMDISDFDIRPYIALHQRRLEHLHREQEHIFSKPIHQLEYSMGVLNASTISDEMITNFNAIESMPSPFQMLLETKPYLYAYYNQALSDLDMSIEENYQFPLLPTLYQFNDLHHKSIRSLHQRIGIDNISREDNVYSHIASQLARQNDGIFHSFLQRLLQHSSNNDHTTAGEPILFLDRIENRFEDEDSIINQSSNDNDNDDKSHTQQTHRHISELQKLLGKTVTKLDMCSMLYNAELERQRVLFDVIPARSIYTNSDLTEFDPRFLFDVHYLQERVSKSPTAYAIAQAHGIDVNALTNDEKKRQDMLLSYSRQPQMMTESNQTSSFSPFDSNASLSLTSAAATLQNQQLSPARNELNDLINSSRTPTVEEIKAIIASNSQYRADMLPQSFSQ